MKLASCKSALNPPVVYSNDRSKAKDLVSSYSLLLCGLFYEETCFKFCLVLFCFLVL